MSKETGPYTADGTTIRALARVIGSLVQTDGDHNTSIPALTLRHHTETKVVDAVQGLGWSRPAVQGERRNAGVVVAIGLDNASDGASQRAYRRRVRRIWPSLL